MNYYLAKVFVRQCLIDIRINDIPLLRQNVDADFTVEMPINYLIESSGCQALTLQMYPKLGNTTLISSAQCSVEIWRYDGGGYKIIPLEQVCSSALSVTAADTTLPFKYDKQLFRSDVAYRITRWGDCEEIKDSRDIAPAVAEYFQEIGRLLADRRYDRYLEYVGNRERNICTALSLDGNESDKRSRMLFECLDNGFVLQPMKGGRLQFYANQRVVTVLNKDMKSILRFANKETGEMLAVELLLGIKRGQKELCIV